MLDKDVDGDRMLLQSSADKNALAVTETSLGSVPLDMAVAIICDIVSYIVL